MRPLSDYVIVNSLPTALDTCSQTQKPVLVKANRDIYGWAAEKTTDISLNLMLEGRWPDSAHLFIDHTLDKPQAEKLAQAIATNVAPNSFEIHFGEGSYSSRRN